MCGPRVGTATCVLAHLVQQWATAEPVNFVTGNVTLTLMGEDVGGAVRDAHNLLRRHAGLPELMWSGALRDIAREWTIASATEMRCEGVRHSSKDFRTAHRNSSFYYVGETITSRRLPRSGYPNNTGTGRELATEAVKRWGHPMLQNVNYGRWGSACTVSQICCDDGQALSEALAVVEGFFQSMWVGTNEVGCEAAFCDFNNAVDIPTRSFILVCEYAPGGNVIGELPFSPTTAAHLDLSSDPCDGPLTDLEWLKWERFDAKHYPLPAGQASSCGFINRPLKLVKLVPLVPLVLQLLPVQFLA